MKLTPDHRIVVTLTLLLCFLCSKATYAIQSPACSKHMIALHQCAKTSTAWPYDPGLQPIALPELQRVLNARNTTLKVRGTVVSRAFFSHLLEYATVECEKQWRSHPENPVLQSLFGSCVVAINNRGYKPSNQKLASQQRKLSFIELGANAIEDAVRGKGGDVSYCWSTLGYLRIDGIMFQDRKLRASYNSGLAALEKAIELDPKAAGAYTQLATALLTMNSTFNPQRALEMARKATEIDPKRSDAYYSQGVALLQLKRQSEGRTAFSRCFALIPPAMRKTAYR